MDAHPLNYFEVNFGCQKLDDAFAIEQSIKIKKFLSTISSKQGQKAYAQRMSDFIAFCGNCQKDWKDVMMIQDFLQWFVASTHHMSLLNSTLYSTALLTDDTFFPVVLVSIP